MKHSQLAVLAALSLISGSAFADNVVLNNEFDVWAPASAVPGIVFADGKMAVDWRIGSPMKDKTVATVSAVELKEAEKALKITKTEANATVEINQYLLTVKPNSTYKFSFKLKAVPAEGSKIAINYSVMTGPASKFWSVKKGAIYPFRKTAAEWTECKQIIKTPADADRAMIRFWILNGTAGEIQLADVELELED